MSDTEEFLSADEEDDLNPETKIKVIDDKSTKNIDEDYAKIHHIPKNESEDNSESDVKNGDLDDKVAHEKFSDMSEELINRQDEEGPKDHLQSTKEISGDFSLATSKDTQIDDKKANTKGSIDLNNYDPKSVSDIKSPPTWSFTFGSLTKNIAGMIENAEKIMAIPSPESMATEEPLKPSSKTNEQSFVDKNDTNCNSRLQETSKLPFGASLFGLGSKVINHGFNTLESVGKRTLEALELQNDDKFKTSSQEQNLPSDNFIKIFDSAFKGDTLSSILHEAANKKNDNNGYSRALRQNSALKQDTDLISNIKSVLKQHVKDMECLLEDRKEYPQLQALEMLALQCQIKCQKLDTDNLSLQQNMDLVENVLQLEPLSSILLNEKLIDQTSVSIADELYKDFEKYNAILNLNINNNTLGSQESEISARKKRTLTLDPTKIIMALQKYMDTVNNYVTLRLNEDLRELIASCLPNNQNALKSILETKYNINDNHVLNRTPKKTFFFNEVLKAIVNILCFSFEYFNRASQYILLSQLKCRTDNNDDDKLAKNSDNIYSIADSLKNLANLQLFIIRQGIAICYHNLPKTIAHIMPSQDNQHKNTLHNHDDLIETNKNNTTNILNNLINDKLLIDSITEYWDDACIKPCYEYHGKILESFKPLLKLKASELKK